MACRPRLLRQLTSPIPTVLRSSHRLFSTAAAADPANTTQIYISRSRDPLLNLSVEHHLLRTASAHATVLMLYANAPCVVFGRNQNPWIEADLTRLARQGGVQLVRRRSGGGTVFHDEGNVNFSVACPSAAFDRDRHAEMVVRALRRLGRPSARVNARHDIVVDAGPDTFKVSGSAYKLTRLRSLHHGTCLLRSPNLASISALLRAPAAPFVKARGVDSVRSPVRNLDLDADAFQEAVVREFEDMYGGPPRLRAVVEHDAAMAVDEVRRGYEEMRAREWVYGQTPRFAFATHPTELDPRPRPELPFKERVHFEAKQGVIERFEIEDGNCVQRELSLVGATVYNFGDWSAQLADAGVASQQAQYIGGWLNGVLGTEFTKP
ncbi:Biotin/lipoate A/B protein ligase [Cordyceps fumosorosea ARSEF 2679]|uniref:Putative lipoate-protein ligase A n=1 Tax=Cordyceps fumosorosea (strain ARSEF 2679) TaxID=1081104 RepID=A0A168BA33_CORFA|nr:Biotin/lipoate A/B protein ligase [Cordyceps fumosorosea ARSEF 2679]OAA69833.1 Biotin/lipoate A/B protein ligase [Cordyceps fumosorosea ARSEF 2679]